MIPRWKESKFFLKIFHPFTFETSLPSSMNNFSEASSANKSREKKTGFLSQHFLENNAQNKPFFMFFQIFFPNIKSNLFAFLLFSNAPMFEFNPEKKIRSNLLLQHKLIKHQIFTYIRRVMQFDWKLSAPHHCWLCICMCHLWTDPCFQLHNLMKRTLVRLKT